MSNTLYKFHPSYDTRTPSLVQKYQQCACEREVTMGAELRTKHGAKVANCGEEPALPVCACVLLVFCSLAPVPLVLVFRSCGGLLRCLRCVAVFAVPACVVPSISSRLTGTRPKNRKNLWAVYGCTLFGQSESFGKMSKERSVDLQ